MNQAVKLVNSSKEFILTTKSCLNLIVHPRTKPLDTSLMLDIIDQEFACCYHFTDEWRRFV